MSNFIEFLKIVVFGLVEGFTEWLPISSTGHLILVENIVHLNASAEFMKVFRVVIQLGAIMAVVVLYFNRLNPWAPGKKKNQQLATWHLWIKILIACLPAAVVGLLLDEVLDTYLYNPYVVAAMLIIYGILFIVLEKHNEYVDFPIKKVSQISYRNALYIGLFQPGNLPVRRYDPGRYAFRLLQNSFCGIYLFPGDPGDVRGQPVKDPPLWPGFFWYGVFLPAGRHGHRLCRIHVFHQVPYGICEEARFPFLWLLPHYPGSDRSGIFRSDGSDGTVTDRT